MYKIGEKTLSSDINCISEIDINGDSAFGEIEYILVGTDEGLYYNSTLSTELCTEINTGKKVNSYYGIQKAILSNEQEGEYDVINTDAFIIDDLTNVYLYSYIQTDTP